MYQIFHIYQIKYLYTKLFENIPNFSNWVYICIPVGNTGANQHRTHSNIQYITYWFYNPFWHHHPDCNASCRL